MLRGNVSVANAYLADLTSEEERNKNYGRMSVASNLGYVFGPAIAGVLGTTAYGEILPVSAALVISIIGTLIVLFFSQIPGPAPLKNTPNPPGLEKYSGRNKKSAIRLRQEVK